VTDTATVSEKCTSKDARLFVSYSCTQTQEVLAEKQNMTSVISCCGVLLVLIYMTVLHYFKRQSDLSQLKWDMQTITPGDYTMQLEISEDMWERAKECLNSIQKHKRQLEDGKSLVSEFKVYMKEELQRILTIQLNKFKDEDKAAEEEAKNN
jgi:hypothetical protein